MRGNWARVATFTRTSSKSCCWQGSGNRTGLGMNEGKLFRRRCPDKSFTPYNTNLLPAPKNWPWSDHALRGRSSLRKESSQQFRKRAIVHDGDTQLALPRRNFLSIATYFMAQKSGTSG